MAVLIYIPPVKEICLSKAANKKHNINEIQIWVQHSYFETKHPEIQITVQHFYFYFQ